MEVVEGDERGDHDIIFKRVGPELRVVEGGFTSTIPSQALSISNKFGLIFFVHPEGFCIAKTRDLVEACQNLNDSNKVYNAKDFSLACVDLPHIQSLALSEDELVIAACAEDRIQYFSVPALVMQEKGRAEISVALLKSLPISDSKLLAWNPVRRGTVLTLSKGRTLTVGKFSEWHHKTVAEDVEAADWSPDGEHFCYITSDKEVHIYDSDLTSESKCRLPVEILNGGKNGGFEAYVDNLKWTRFDSILVSCLSRELENEEDNPWIFMLVSNGGSISQDPSNAKIVCFEGFFTSIDSSILAFEKGPFTLADYIQPWDLFIMTNRKCIDDHISLLGWCDEGAKSKISKLKILDDRFTPRIELQESGDDNYVVGLAVDRTTLSIEIAGPNGESGETLEPGPVLFCMTIEGNLSLFSVARMTNKGKGRGIVKIPSELPGEEVVLHSYDLESKAGDGKGDAKEEAQNRNESKVGFAKTDNLTSNTFGTQGLQRKTSQNKERVITTADQVSFKPNGPAAERIPEITPQSKGISFTTPIQSFKQQQLPKQSLPATEIFKGQIKGALENVKELDRKDLQAAYALGMGAQQTPSLVDSRKNLGSPVGRTAIAPGLSEMEVKFQSEIIKVKEMSGVIENLMSYIEGKGSLKKGERQLSFTRTHVEAIEHTTQKLFKECQTLREEMQEQRCNIMDLRDEVLQVDSWRMYVQSIIEQLFDERYQELCNKQTLHPELAGMRKRILQADQSLKQQIAELEEHLHNLELYEWQKKKQLNMKAVTSERLSRSMQGIYETINTQMEVAQQLSRRITLQSQALKLPVIPKEELESMLSNLKMQDMASQERPVVRTRGRLSSSGPLDFSPANRTVKSSLQTPSKQLISTGVRAGLQDSTRRRRDSVDKFWVDVGAAKTTVKRATPVKRFDALSSISKDTLKSEPITSRKEALYSPEGLYSRTGARQVKTDMSVFGSGHVEKYSREVMANAQSERMSSAQPDKLMAMGGGFTAAQPLQQKMAQMESPTTVSASWGPVVTTDTLQAYAPTGPQSMPKTRSEKKPSKSFGEEIDKALPASVICEGASVSNLSFTKAVAHSQQTAAVSDLEGGPTVAVLSVPPRITEIQRTETSRAQVHPSQAFEIKKPEFQISKTDTSINERTSAFPSFGLASVLKSSSNSNSTFAISMSSSEQGTGQMTSMPKPSEVCDTPLSSPPNIVQSVSSMPICQTLSFSSSETASSLAFPAHAPGSTLFTSVPQNNNISSTQSSVLLSSAAGVIAQASSPALNVSSQSAVKGDGIPNVMTTEPSVAPLIVNFSHPAVQDSSNDSDEEEMEEEANNATVFGSSSFTGFGLGSTPPVTSQRSTPFGLGSSFSPTESSPFGGASVWNQQSSSTLSGSPGQLFKPASFSIPAAPVTTTPSSSSPFGQTVTSANAGQSGFGTVGLITPQVTSGGQQALGSALGSFGQTRQIGSPFGTPSASGFGFTTGAGFANTASSAGFSSAATGGGFASIAASGGFANIASGSGFAGFAGGAAGNSSPSPNQGGFGAFSGGAFSAFGGHTNPSLFTQMRK